MRQVSGKEFVKAFEKGMFKGRVQERDVIEGLLRRLQTTASSEYQDGLRLAIMAVTKHARIKESK